VLAVTRLDDRPVGRGRPGEVFKVIHQAYQEFKRKVMRAAA
jgi:D-alanine transaminase